VGAIGAGRRMRPHACTVMSSEERKKTERKALKLPTEDGVRHELLWEVPSGHAREKKER